MQLVLVALCAVPSNVSSCLFRIAVFLSDDFSDRRAVEEQERLRAEAQKAEAIAAEAMARASRLRKQLDFLEGRDRHILRSELECLELLDAVTP